VPLSRARLTLTPGGVPAMVLDGLAQYSHCWVLYVFHENSDLGRLCTDPDNKNFRAKVSMTPPRHGFPIDSWAEGFKTELMMLLRFEK
jgi:tRNA (Thr-GGU) A37 N-methylase